MVAEVPDVDHRGRRRRCQGHAHRGRGLVARYRARGDGRAAGRSQKCVGAVRERRRALLGTTRTGRLDDDPPYPLPGIVPGVAIGGCVAVVAEVGLDRVVGAADRPAARQPRSVAAERLGDHPVRARTDGEAEVAGRVGVDHDRVGRPAGDLDRSARDRAAEVVGHQARDRRVLEDEVGMGEVAGRCDVLRRQRRGHVVAGEHIGTDHVVPARRCRMP